MIVTTLDNYNGKENELYTLTNSITKTPIQVNFDGLCQPCNPRGIACYAFVVKTDGNTIQSEYGLAAEPFSADAINNIVEYTAIIKALEWLQANNYENQSIVIKGDSQLVISQIKREFKVKVKAPRIIPLYRSYVSYLQF